MTIKFSIFTVKILCYKFNGLARIECGNPVKNINRNGKDMTQ